MTNLSVIIPTFNALATIENAILSALSEIDESDEVIVVDDGSSDGTLAVLQSRTLDSRVRLLSNARAKGAAGARNTGLAAAEGEYVAFLDADDHWLAGGLAARMDEFLDGNVVGVFGGAIINTSSGRRVVGWEGEVSVFDIAMSKVSILTPTIIVRRSTAVIAGLFNETMPRSQDLEFLMRLRACGSIVGVKAPSAEVDWRRAREVAIKFEQSLPALIGTLNNVLPSRFAGRAQFQFVCRGVGLHLRERHFKAALSLFCKCAPRKSSAWSIQGLTHIVKGVFFALGWK